MDTLKLEAEVLKLPRELRARLAERLLNSLDEEDEVEQAWDAEARERYELYLRGGMHISPAEEAVKRVRRGLGS